MSEPCQQEGAIGKLEATTHSIGETLKQLSSVLEKIASQGTTIQHLSEGQNILFDRVRNMELTAESQKVKVGFVMSLISIVSSAVTAFLFKHFGGH